MKTKEAKDRLCKTHAWRVFDVLYPFHHGRDWRPPCLLSLKLEVVLAPPLQNLTTRFDTGHCYQT